MRCSDGSSVLVTPSKVGSSYLKVEPKKVWSHLKSWSTLSDSVMGSIVSVRCHGPLTVMVSYRTPPDASHARLAAE